MSPWLLVRIERLLERGVRESATATMHAEALEGASFRIHVEGLGIDVVLRVRDRRILVQRSADDTVDATVRGAPLDLLRVLHAGSASRLAGSGVTLTGRVHVAEQFAQLLRIAMPDPEEELSRWVGDILAYRAGTAVREAGAWALQAFEALRADTAEYLTEEGRLLPTRYEADALFADIERLRDDIERAEARLDRLAEHGVRRRAGVDIETP